MNNIHHYFRYSDTINDDFECMIFTYIEISGYIDMSLIQNICINLYQTQVWFEIVAEKTCAKRYTESTLLL